MISKCLQRYRTLITAVILRLSVPRIWSHPADYMALMFTVFSSWGRGGIHEWKYEVFSLNIKCFQLDRIFICQLKPIISFVMSLICPSVDLMETRDKCYNPTIFYWVLIIIIFFLACVFVCF